MATNTKKTTEAIENTEDNRVAVTLPRARGNEEPNLFVSINGTAYLIPKGETTMGKQVYLFGICVYDGRYTVEGIHTR